MPAQVHLVPTRTHGRVLVEAPPTAGPWPTLLGFHGYAENAAIHMEILRRLDPAGRWLKVSAQGLHRFYSREEAVVASWMTREDREAALADNVAYAAAVRAMAVAEGGGAPLVLVGFSQGVAQAYRAASAAGTAAHGVLVLAGDVPPDVAPRAGTLPPILLGRGRRDAWYTATTCAADRDLLRAAGAQVTVVEFDGGHDWDERFVEAARAWLDRRLAG
jgi:predicted esterase